MTCREESLSSELLESAAKDPDGVALAAAIDFSIDVSEELERAGMTQTELAQRMGVSRSALSQMLSESSNLTLRSVAKIVHALGKSFSIKIEDSSGVQPACNHLRTVVRE